MQTRLEGMRGLSKEEKRLIEENEEEAVEVASPSTTFPQDR